MHRLRWLLALMVAIAPSVAVAQSGGTVRGTVIDANSMRPIPSAQVFIDGTELGTLTNAQGRYQITNVPAGQYTVRTQLLGYEAGESSVTVAAGESVTANFRLQSTAVELEELVVTGVAGATPKTKLPFEVGTVDMEDQPVPAVSASGALQGKVAGARVVQGSGQPGDGAEVTLRGATSINASGRSQSPLYIVDDVVLGSESLVDIDPQDIKSIEVVKGAAAASLYGSRAANGVIRITTKRGQGLDEGETRFAFRAEAGVSELGNSIDLAQNHPYRMNDAKTAFVDKEGNEIDYADAVLAGTSPFNTFQDNPYPGQTFDQIDRFFDPGNFRQTYVSATGRTKGLNYYASYSNLRESGVIEGHEGFKRQNFRLNLDQGLNDDLRISLSTFYSNSWKDDVGSSPFFALTFMPPNADLLAKDDDGSLVIQPDPRSQEANPLYEILNRESIDERSRFMGSGIIRYAPVTWFDVEANISYDRSDLQRRDYYPKGYKSIEPSAANFGQLERRASIDEALNTSLTASLYQTFGKLSTRTKARYLYESADAERFNAFGQNLAVVGVPQLSVASGSKDVGSGVETIRSKGFFFITALDYDDKYIVDGLVRRDGSSLFGSEERWHTYYRGSAAWRVSMEPWWFGGDAINEFKLRTSYGTAGGRPRFDAQYETYSVVDGRVVPQTLGNTKLKPEFARELETGVDFELFDRVEVGLTYAHSTVDDQLLQVPLPGYAGFKYQWQNAGTLESNTFEASLGATLVQTQDFSWNSRLLLDRTISEITRLDIPAYQIGYGNAFYIREGEVLGTFYGHKFATSCADLPGVACDQFEVNDDGYLVWVGNNSYTDISRFGTTGEVGGKQYQFGMPVYATCQDDEGNPTNFCEMGNTTPDLNVSLSNNLDWKGLSLYALFDASVGQRIYNQTRQWAFRELRAGEIDQSDKPEDLRKPVAYYSTLYDVNGINSHFVEDGSFLKLRELSLRYSLGKDLLDKAFGGRTDRVTLSLIGRNLFTWTDYSGYDPEIGIGGGGNDQVGAASIARFDAYQYPNFRTLTASVEIGF